jgi:hypothetical protein
MRLNCDGKDCTNSIEISSTSACARYTCKEHLEAGPDDVRFQRHQFDEVLGPGTDPRVYEQRRTSKQSSIKFPNIGRPRKNKLKRTTKLLAGHPNAEKILAVLTEEVHDSNLG